MTQAPLHSNAFLVTKDGVATRYFRAWLEALRNDTSADVLDLVTIASAEINGLAARAASAESKAIEALTLSSVTRATRRTQSDVPNEHLISLVPAVMGRPLNVVPKPVASVYFNDQQATSFRIENRTSDPGSPTEGQIWLRTDL